MITDEFVKDANSGISIVELMDRYNIRRTTAYNLRNECKYSYTALQYKLLQKENEQLVKELAEYELQREIFDACGVTNVSSMSDRITAALKLRNAYPVRTICRILKIGRAYFYRQERALTRKQKRFKHEKTY